MKRRKFIQSFSLLSLLATKSYAWETEPFYPSISINEKSFEKAFNEIRGDRVVVESKEVEISMPEIAENGAVVPIMVQVNSPMSSDDYVKCIHLLTKNHSNSRFISVYLSPKNGKAIFRTLLNLDESATVFAIVELSDGRVIQASKYVKVSIGGGCC